MQKKCTVKKNKLKTIKKYLDYIDYLFEYKFNQTTEIFLSTYDIFLHKDNMSDNILKWEVNDDNESYIEFAKRTTICRLEYLNSIGISKELGRMMVQVGLIKPMSQFSWHKDLPPWIPVHRRKPKQLKKLLESWIGNDWKLWKKIKN